MYKSEDAMFGMFYLPPGVYYPAHRHEPLEIYHVIQGKARFFLAEAEAEANHSSAASSCSAKIHGPESWQFVGKFSDNFCVVKPTSV